MRSQGEESFFPVHAGTQTQGLANAGQVLYHGATSLAGEEQFLSEQSLVLIPHTFSSPASHFGDEDEEKEAERSHKPDPRAS